MTPAASDGDIICSLETFIREDLLYDRDDVQLDRNTQLLEKGLVDSMGIFRLICFIEENFGVELQPSEVQVEHFRDMDSIVALVQSREQA
jgi:acyl carrier protein